jgi:hypothetical protein
MRNVNRAVISFVLCLLAAAAGWAQDMVWPRERTERVYTLITYQPQVDDWKDFRELDWRMAFSLAPAGGKPAIGVAELHGQTTVDGENKMVLIDNLKIKRTHFPSLDPASAELMDQMLRSFLPPAVTVSLHQLVASTPKPESPQGVELKNDPPVIFVSYQPAILLDVDGIPVRAPIGKSGLEYVVNTHWRLFFDASKSTYYLLAGEGWLQATDLQGPWSAATKLPREMEKLPKEAQWADLNGWIPPPPAKPAAAVPTVFHSTGPAEIILFDGKPEYSQIPDTGLRYATNTISYLFLHVPTNQYYYLTAGRWFRADGLGGPWTFATPTLPGDFARIPRDSPAAQVLPSVPGTEEAKDAILMARIPTTVTVKPSAAAGAKVAYDGSPKFAPIQGTALYYATNTAQKVIRVGDLYYLCLQGIWFVSPNPQGPWQTAQSIPQAIYAIPPSSPVYNVTYVTQVTTSDGSVQASYTSGYMGAFTMGTAAGVVIAGGTGYYYPPYVAPLPAYGYPVYYPTPYTYGAGSYYSSATGAYGVSQTAYGPYGSATRTASYNPYSGTYARTASATTAYGSAAVGQAYNPYTGAYGATKQGSNAYSQWGSSVVSKGGETAYTQHETTSKGTVGSVQTSSGGKAAGASTAYGSTAAGKTASGDMYAGHDGNVYKNTGSGWEKYNDGSWSSVKPPASTNPTGTTQSAAQQKPTSSQESSAQQRAEGAESQRPSSSGRSGEEEQMQRMQQEAQNRQRGAEQSERFQQFQHSGGGGGERGFGGHGGGGGGRGRR